MIKVKNIVFPMICLFLCFFASGQQSVFYTAEDKAVFDRYVEYISPYKNKPLNEVVIETGKFFIDVPYVAHTLEREPEQLVLNLRELDCTTFVETVLALSRTVKGDKLSFDSFTENLQTIRYREGVIEDYTSRLHYMTDWIIDNEKAGIVKDITAQIGGEPLKVNLFFMSAHPDSYKQLSDPSLIEKLRLIENKLNAEANLYYIPKQKAVQHVDKVQNGDIVLFATSIGGLDVTHVGFIYKERDKTTFIHASTTGKKVVINDVSLVDYMTRSKNNIGMLILRPL